MKYTLLIFSLEFLLKNCHFGYLFFLLSFLVRQEGCIFEILSGPSSIILLKFLVSPFKFGYLFLESLQGLFKFKQLKIDCRLGKVLIRVNSALDCVSKLTLRHDKKENNK